MGGERTEATIPWNRPPSADTRPANGDPPFHPIQGPKASTEVVDQISAAISSGRFLPGARLPNIDELARAMDVSRPTVGDALRLLARAGVIATRRGNSGGVLVTSSIVPPRLLRLSRPRVVHSLSALVEARRAVEMELALLACRRATDDDFAAMERSVEMLKASVGDPRQWAQANNLFHYAVGRAARSPVLSQFQHEVIREMTVLLDGWNAEYYTGADRVIGMHESTLEALRSRNLARVRVAMADHLHDAETVAATVDATVGGRRERSRRRVPRARPGSPHASKEQGSRLSERVERCFRFKGKRPWPEGARRLEEGSPCSTRWTPISSKVTSSGGFMFAT